MNRINFNKITDTEIYKRWEEKTRATSNPFSAIRAKNDEEKKAIYMSVIEKINQLPKSYKKTIDIKLKNCPERVRYYNDLYGSVWRYSFIVDGYECELVVKKYKPQYESDKYKSGAEYRIWNPYENVAYCIELAQSLDDF